MKPKLYLLAGLLLIAAGFASCDKNKNEPEVSFTVTFDSDGGSPTPPSQTVKAGEAATAPANPAKQDYVFLFWHLNGTSTAYNFQTPVNSNITLKAKWENAAVVEYRQVAWELNGGTWPATGDNHATQVVKGGTLAEPAAPTKAGNTFDGWYKEAALTNKVSFPYDVSSVTSNIRLYAKWAAGGTGDPTGYRMFTSISELKSWLSGQPANTAEAAYKVGLKNVNLDSGNNWWDLGLAVKGSNYVDLNLQGCTGATIPDGYLDIKGTPPSVTITTYGAFIGCYNLLAISLPGSLKTIGKYAFKSCSRLGSIILPDGLENINSDAFYYCGISSITFPEGLKTIGGDAFARSGLTAVTIPGSVKNLSAGAFMYCESLVSIILKEGVETIGNDAFLDCPLTSSINLPASLKKIEKGTFSYCSFSTITIPKGVTNIGEEAFAYIKELTEIVMLPTTPPALPPVYPNPDIHHIFYNSPNLKTIKVPAASLSTYKTAGVWSRYANIVVANTN